MSGTVEVSSRHRHSHQTYSKMFYHGRPASVAKSSSHRASVGTTVTLHDVFYNVPVRRKGLSEALEIESIRQTLRGLALADPSISFSLRNDAMADCVMQIKKTCSLLGTFSVLFGSKRAGSMKEVHHRSGLFVISGIVSTESHYSKSLQFVFINGRLVKKTALHTCVNNILSNSLICRSILRRGDSSKWSGAETGRDTASPRRTSDKHGVYVLKLKCPRTEYDICLEPAKTLVEFKNWDIVLDALREAVGTFLRRHSLNLGLENPEGNLLQDKEENSSENQNCNESEEIYDNKLGHDWKLSPCQTAESSESYSMTPQADIDEDNNADASVEGVIAGANGQTTIANSSVSVRVLQRESADAAKCRLGGDVGYARSPLHSHSLASKLSCLLQRKSAVDASTEKNAVVVERVSVPGKQAKEHGLGSANSMCEKEQRMASHARAWVPSTGSNHLSVNQPINMHLSNSKMLSTSSQQRSNVRKTHQGTFLHSTGNNELRSLITRAEVSDGCDVHKDIVKGFDSLDSVAELTQEQEVGVQSVDGRIHCRIDTSQEPCHLNSNRTANSIGQLLNSSGGSSQNGSLASRSLLVPGKAVPASGKTVAAEGESLVEACVKPREANTEISSLWQETTDPMTRKTIYIHKRTGNARTTALWKQNNVAAFPDCVPCPNTSNKDIVKGFDSLDSVAELTQEQEVGVQSVDGRIHCRIDTSQEPCHLNSNRTANSIGQLLNSSGGSSQNGSLASRSLLVPGKAVPASGKTVAAEGESLVEACVKPREANTEISSLWQETTDPMTRKTIYIHKRTGNARTTALWKQNNVAAFPDCVPCPNTSNKSAIDNLLDIETNKISRVCSSSYGSRPLEAAPHLSFGFDRFAPSAMRLRMGRDSLTMKRVASVDSKRGSNEGGECSSRSWSGGISVGVDCIHSDTGSDTALQRRDSESNDTLPTQSAAERQWNVVSSGLKDVVEERLGFGGERPGLDESEVTNVWEKGSFEKLLESWTNPVFLAGQQVMSYC